MKRVIQVLFAVAAIMISAGSPKAEARPSPGPAGEPRAVLPFTSYDFGDIRRGEIISQIFPIRNEGNADLIIKGIDAACSCEVAQADKLIPPGKTGTVRVQVETALQSGAIFKFVTLSLNDPNQAAVKLTLTANILGGVGDKAVKGGPFRAGLHIGPLFVGPAEYWSVPVVQGQKAKFAFTITVEREPLKILRVEGGEAHFVSRVETVEEGKSYKIVLESLPADTPNNFSERLSVITDSKLLPSLSLGLSVTVIPK